MSLHALVSLLQNLTDEREFLGLVVDIDLVRGQRISWCAISWGIVLCSTSTSTGRSGRISQIGRRLGKELRLSRLRKPPNSHRDGSQLVTRVDTIEPRDRRQGTPQWDFRSRSRRSPIDLPEARFWIVSVFQGQSSVVSNRGCIFGSEIYLVRYSPTRLRKAGSVGSSP
jgi:hypothetical protein